MKRNEKGQISKKYSDEYIIKLLEENKNTKLSLNIIAQRENISAGTLLYRSKKLGYNISKRRKFLNENYFENIDTDLKAYFLGFIMADGCITKTSKTNKYYNRLSINISKKDRIILEKFKEEIEASYDIKDYFPNNKTFGEYEMSRIDINSKKICNDLIQYGICNNKTGFECLPNIKKSLLPSFVRGFLDGDGTINTNGHIGFCSCLKMIKDLKELFLSWGMTGKLTIRKDNRHDNIYNIYIFKKEDKSIFYNKVYKKSKFHLERKHNKIKI